MKSKFSLKEASYFVLSLSLTVLETTELGNIIFIPLNLMKLKEKLVL